jgi:hypothetical protein
MRVAVVHELPGRVRLRANPYALRRYNTAGIGLILSEFRGVKKVAVNPRTGSILILYDTGSVSKEEFFSLLQDMTPLQALTHKTAGKKRIPLPGRI